jgi:hypothetical protein
VRERCDITEELTAHSIAGFPVAIPAGHAVFAILNPATEKTDQIRFTWGSLGYIW